MIKASLSLSLIAAVVALPASGLAKSALDLATHSMSTCDTSKWVFADDCHVFSAFEPLPADIDPFDAYTKMIGSTKNETLTWWYNGLGTVVAEGLPPQIGYSSQTMEIFKVTHSDENTWRADWYELIRSTDANTQLPLTEFVNALTGAKYTPASVYFNDGPVTWFVSRNNETGGVNLRIVQSGALMFSSTVKMYLYDGRVQVYHVGKKVKPATSYQLITNLLTSASIADVQNASLSSVLTRGSYYSNFVVPAGGMPIAYGFPNGTAGTIQLSGSIFKGTDYDRLRGNESEQLFPDQWTAWQTHFPTQFKNGLVTNDWDAMFDAYGPIGVSNASAYSMNYTFVA